MSGKITAIRVDLEDDQIATIMPMIAEAREAGDRGEPGMLLAQVVGDHAHVFFIDGAAAMRVQAALGCTVGLTTADVRLAGGVRVGRA